MHKTVAKRRRAIRKLFFADEPHECEDPLEYIQPLLNMSGIELQRLPDHRRIKLITLHTRRYQQPAILFAELIYFFLNHAADRFWKTALDIIERLHQGPLA